MHITDIIWRDADPAPWAEGDNIPWNDPAFSQRMLREHLSQAHDAASRRFAKIDAQVAWIHQQVLGGQPASILDLGCGPGLYAERLTRLGHRCVGIDFSPASIDYATCRAQGLGLDIIYHLEDLRRAEYGSGFDLVMLLFGELNVFTPEDARLILAKAREALSPGGRILLEPHTAAAVRAMGDAGKHWAANEAGLFSERPHLVLTEHVWREASQTATIRYYVVDAASGSVSRLAQSMQRYTEEGYRDLLRSVGYAQVTFYPSLIGEPDPSQEAFLAITARAV